MHILHQVAMYVASYCPDFWVCSNKNSLKLNLCSNKNSLKINKVMTVGGFTEIATNLFAYNNKMKFSTSDNENDKHSSLNCAASFKSGW